MDTYFDFFCNFLTCMDLNSLKCCNKYWNMKIEKEWLIEKLSIIYTFEKQIHIPKKMRFVQYLEFVFNTEVQEISGHRNMENVYSIYIDSCRSLNKVVIPNNIKFLHIGGCPKLDIIKLLEVVPNCITTLQLVDVELCDFKLKKTWIYLDSLVLTNSNIHSLEIPEELQNLIYINISGTNICSLAWCSSNENVKDTEFYSYNLKNNLNIYNAPNLNIITNCMDKINVISLQTVTGNI